MRIPLTSAFMLVVAQQLERRNVPSSLLAQSRIGVRRGITHKEIAMRLNVATKPTVFTHEGAPAFAHMKPEQALRRSVLSCLLWEDQFYEDGKSIAERITENAEKVTPEILAALAVEARSVFNLRHVPLLLIEVLSRTGKGKPIVADTVEAVIQRADEMGELLAILWRGGRKMVPAQMRKGLARAFVKFNEYQLAKYDRDGAVKLRDVLRMVRPKPANEEQSALWKCVKDRTLVTPDTWEVALSGGADKKEAFERLLREGKLGYLALLRNLRNMTEAKVDEALIRNAIVARKGGAERVLPFRYIAAARAVPRLEPSIDQALCEAITEMPVLPGKTAVLVDVSRSMDDKLSAKSDMTRVDAACALASMVHGDVRMFSFSDQVVEVPPRRGMAGVDALRSSQTHNGTRLFDAVALINKEVPYDRLIVITDEQATGGLGYGIQGTVAHMPDPKMAGYLINVASAKNGVGYGKWVHLDGFSEAVLRFIIEHERSATR